MGKAHHVRHPEHTVYADRRARNDAILTRNKQHAATRADRMRSLVAKADTAAYLEARANAHARDTWQPEPATLEELQATYGRTSPLARLLARDIAAQGAKAAATHTWLPRHAEQNGPGIMTFLLGEVATRKPGHPLFSVTARDLAFVFYTWGLTTLDGLRRSLQNVAEEEARLHPKAVKKMKPRPPLPKRPPPTLPNPKALKLARLRSFAPAPANIYLKRIEQLNAFQARYQRRQQHHANRQAERLNPTALRRSGRLASSDGSGVG